MGALSSVPGAASPGAASPGDPGAAPGAVTVYVAGQAAQSYPAGAPLAAGAIVPTAALSLPVPVVLQQAGDWMIAIITWRPLPGDVPAPSVSVEDDARNWWDPPQPNADSSASGVTRTAVWIAPAARPPVMNPAGGGYVMVAPSGYVTAVACTVLGVTGMAPWVSVTGLVTTFANAATALAALALAAPPALAVMVTGCGADDNADTVSLAGSGWSLAAPVAASNGADHTADITLSSAWQVTSGAGSATWSASGSLDLSGTICGLLISAAGPVQPNPSWPAVVYPEVAPGAGPGTPASQLGWASLGNRFLGLRQWVQGRQYTLAQLQAGQGTLVLDNPDYALTPPGSGAFSGIDSGAPWRVRVAVLGQPCPWYVLASGFAQRLPPSWPAVMRGQVQATVTDAAGYLGRSLRSAFSADGLEDGPWGSWRCDDPAGSLAAASEVPGNPLPLVVTLSKYGTGGATQAFGQNSGALPGNLSTVLTASGITAAAGGGMWGQTLPSATFSPAGTLGYFLSLASGSFPQIANGMAIEMWFQTQAPALTSYVPTLFAMGSSGRLAAGLSVLPPASGNGLQFVSSTGSGIAATGIGSVNYYATSPGPLTQVGFNFTTSGWICYVNGVSVASGTWGISAAQLPFTMLTVGGGQGSLPGVAPNSLAFAFGGFTGGVRIYPRPLPAARFLAHYQAGLGMGGEDVAQRMERLAAWGNPATRRLILPSTGRFTTPAATTRDVGGNPASTALNNIASSTLPAVYTISPTNAVTYLPRQYACNQPARWILGDDTAAGEIPFLPTYAPDYDPARVVNDPQVAQLDDNSVQLPYLAAQEAASQVQYGYQSAQVTGYLQGDVLAPYSASPGCTDLVNWVADTTNVPRMRIAQVTVDAARHPSAWPFVAGVANGDVLTANLRMPTAGGQLLTITGRVTQTTRDLSFDTDGGVTGSVTCVIDNAPELAALTADHPALGLLGVGNRLPW